MRPSTLVQLWRRGDVQVGDRVQLKGFIVGDRAYENRSGEVIVEVCWMSDDEQNMDDKEKAVHVARPLAEIFRTGWALLGGSHSYAYDATLSGTVFPSQQASFPVTVGEITRLTIVNDYEVFESPLEADEDVEDDE